MKQIMLLLIALISVTGCTAKKTPFELAQDGPTMKENYSNHISNEVGSEVGSGAMKLGIVRSLESDINYSRIEEYGHRRVSNPEMRMFIYPHRSTRHGAIVPGYFINFPMYEKVQYNLIGDIAYGK